MYLCSPETATAAALFGKITDPRKIGDYPNVSNPEHYVVNDDNLLLPPEDSSRIEVLMGPNIKPFPKFGALDDDIQARVMLKVGDNITTDHVMPAGARILPLRSNIEAISEFVFTNVDHTFAGRCREAGDGVVIGGENYGQGSSREHAAIAPRYLGIRAKIAKSFARIHKANLINFGILPLTFANAADYDLISQGDAIRFSGVRRALEQGLEEFSVEVAGRTIPVKLEVTERGRRILRAGGLINTVRG